MWTKAKTIEFIELFREKECLWEVKSKDYSNRSKRERAYEDLLDFVKTFFPDANRDTICSKINNLRSSWRKEMKKLRASELSGAGTEEIYEPSLLYFESMMFLCDSETPRPGRDNEPINANSQNDDELVDIDDSASIESSPPLSAENESNLGPCTAPLPQPTPLHATNGKGRAATKRKREDSQESQLLRMACRELATPEAVTKDELDCFGMSVTHALRDMPRDQMLHAKKLISEVIYEGQLNNLSRASFLTALPAIAFNTSTAGPTNSFLQASGEYSTRSTDYVYRNYQF